MTVYAWWRGLRGKRPQPGGFFACTDRGPRL